VITQFHLEARTPRRPVLWGRAAWFSNTPAAEDALHLQRRRVAAAITQLRTTFEAIYKPR
jgi:hypothetical protein